MAEEFDASHGTSAFGIYPRSEPNRPIGVDYSKVGAQPIFVGAPVYDWKFKKVGNYWRLSVGGYSHVGVPLHGKFVIASIEPLEEEDWIIHRLDDGTYTITLAKHPGCGWTVFYGCGERQEISIQRIKPEPSPDQRFLFRRLNE